jgi:hypothetical protein
MAIAEIPDDMRNSPIIIEDNELYENNLTGIRIRGSIPIAIKTCRIYSNGAAGISIDGRAIASDKYLHILVTDCRVFQNGRAGVNIEEATRITVKDSNIYKNKLAGLRMWRSGEEEGRVLQAKVANNSIFGNGEGGIRCMPKPYGDGEGRAKLTTEPDVDLLAVDNNIYQNKRAGIRVENDTKLTAEGNNIRDNGMGIVSHVSVIPPKLDIYRNKLSSNSGPGIHVVNGITGPIGIRNNWIFDNRRSGIVCGLWDNPDIHKVDVEIINNTIVSNGSDNKGAGIRNESDGKVTIMNNIIAYNYEAGIRAKRCPEDSYNLLFANGDMGNCCDDPESTVYWALRLQFGGCPERGKGDLIYDPLFVDSDSYNFYLQDESLAIDAGAKVDIYNDVHFPPSKGTDRNDMGATGGPYASKRESLAF